MSQLARQILSRFSPHAVALAVVMVLFASLPFLETTFSVGHAWQGIMPTFGDETMYYVHVHEIGEGYLNDGNPYYAEHRMDPPLVIFGGAWLAAVPLWLGIPFDAAMAINYMLWSAAFCISCYWLLRELGLPRTLAIAVLILVFAECYTHIIRPANLQQVWPVFFFFGIALSRFLRAQSRRIASWLAAALAASFYLFAYLWQAFAVTLGLLALWSLIRQDMQMLRNTLLAGAIGCLIGLPAPLYIYWLSRTNPFFWESLARFGLNHTHVPMAEIFYSGGWALFLIALGWLLWRFSPKLRAQPAFSHLLAFTTVSGGGLWLMQGSNAFTGVLLETGDHLRTFIVPWFLIMTFAWGALLFRERTALARPARIAAVAALCLCAGANAHFLYAYMRSYLPLEAVREYWRSQQEYAGVFNWLNAHAKPGDVVWTNPQDDITLNLPIYTKQYVLYAPFAMWHLASNEELYERYLTAEYFEKPDEVALRRDVAWYVGRDHLHAPKTREREVKICRLIHFLDPGVCGAYPASVEKGLGDAFFETLSTRFAGDIAPKIEAYLAKYHVGYILKDKRLHSHDAPEKLGAKPVYEDRRYLLYHYGNQ
jgi:hypothetical protein